jgi:hypothetical protein
MRLPLPVALACRVAYVHSAVGVGHPAEGGVDEGRLVAMVVEGLPSEMEAQQ